MDKYIWVKTIEKPLDRNNKPYLKIIDHEGQAWSFFRTEFTFELNKCYELSYTLNDKNFPQVSSIKPLSNKFMEQALKQVANINDIKKDVFMSLSYAKDISTSLAQNGEKIPLEEVFKWSDQIYDYATKKAQEEYEKATK